MDSLDLTREARKGSNSILRQPAHAVRIQDRPDNKRKSHERQHQRDRESRKNKSGLSDDCVHIKPLMFDKVPLSIIDYPLLAEQAS